MRNRIAYPIIGVLASLFLVAIAAYPQSDSVASETKTVTSIQVTTVVQAQTVTSSQITTVIQTQTYTPTQLRSGNILLNYSGSGDANSPQFTATTSTVKVILKVIPQADLQFVGVSWYIKEVGTQGSVTHGDMDNQAGTFEQYGYGLREGMTYNVYVISANASWEIIVEEVS